MATNIDKKNLNVPNLRFPEFTGEWKRYRVSDFLDFYSTNSLSWEQLDYSAGEIKNLHYGLIHKGLSSIVNIDECRLPFIKESNIPKNYTLCKDGDIAFADASEDTNDVAKAVEFVNCDGKKITCGLHTIHGRDRLNITYIGYKAFAFSSPKFCVQINKIAQGTKVFAISAKNFNELFIGIPSLGEQKKIVSLLSLIDERIATQSKIIEDLVLLKSALTNYFFQTNTQWTKCCIGDILKIGSGKDYKHLKSGCIPVYGTGGYMLSVNDFLYDGDSVCIGRKGTINAPLFLSGKFWTVDTLFYTHDYHNVLPRFCFYLFTTINWLYYNEASGVPSLSKNTIEKIEIAIPSIDKQKYICTILDNIYDKIELETRLNAEYQNQRQYLLQHLFI